jgi:hypothetical protein
MVIIFDRAVRAGVSVERVGELVFPAYKRANPTLFDGKTVLNGFELLERAYRDDTTYGGAPRLRSGGRREGGGLSGGRWRAQLPLRGPLARLTFGWKRNPGASPL